LTVWPDNDRVQHGLSNKLYGPIVANRALRSDYRTIEQSESLTTL